MYLILWPCNAVNIFVYLKVLDFKELLLKQNFWNSKVIIRMLNEDNLTLFVSLIRKLIRMCLLKHNFVDFLLPKAKRSNNIFGTYS